MFPESRRLACALVGLLALPLATAAHASVRVADSSVVGEPAKEILASSQSAMVHLKSFHLEGTASPLTLDLNLSARGGGGTISEPGAQLDVVVVGKTIYIKANEQSWDKLAQNASVAKTVANKWIKAPASSSDFSDFADLTIPKDFVPQVFSGDSGLSVVPGTKQVNGQAAVDLSDGQGGNLYVVAQGTPYLLRISAPGSAGTLNFSEFGVAKIPTAPANAITLP